MGSLCHIGELVSPPTALQLPEEGLGEHRMCPVCVGLSAQLCPLREKGGQAVTRGRKDGTDISGGISGYEERSLLC